MLEILVIGNNHKAQEKLSTFLLSMGHHLTFAKFDQNTLDVVAQSKPHIAFILEDESHQEIQDFIIKVSQLKIFNQTSFSMVSDKEMSSDTKMKFMCLGFGSFFNLQDENTFPQLSHYLNAELKYYKISA